MNYPSERETRVHAFVFPVRLQFQEGIDRNERSALFKRMRACMRKEGMACVWSRNWAICLPVHVRNLEQARITIAMWLLDQPELDQFSVFFPAPAFKVLLQKERIDSAAEEEHWRPQPRGLRSGEALPLMATMCGYALSFAVAQCGGEK